MRTALVLILIMTNDDDIIIIKIQLSRIQPVMEKIYAQ